MDSLYRFLTLGIPWTQSMPSRHVIAATQLAEASWRRDKKVYSDVTLELSEIDNTLLAVNTGSKTAL